MSKQPRIIAIVRPIKGCSERHQIAACEASGASVYYVIGVDCEHWRDAVRSVRSGDGVAVHHLALLPQPKSRKVIPSQDMRDAIEDIEARGGYLVEAATRRDSRRAADRKAMIAEAARSLGAGGRSLSSEQARINGAKAGSKRGRPAKVFSSDEIAEAKRVWESRKVSSWAEAAKLLPKGFTVARAHRMFGGRGT